MRTAIRALALGVVFGAMLSWSGMTSPDVIRGALLFEQSYLFLFFASAVGTAAVGLWLVGRRRPAHAAPRERVQRRHVVGSAVFGLGWGIADACPGPILTQVGQGIAWGAVLLVGVVVGVRLHLRRSATETEPAADAPVASAVAAPVRA